MTTQPLSPLTMLLSRHTRRREFITLLGGAAAAWPLTARAEQAAVPVVGLLDQRSPDELADRLRGFRQGLRDSDFVEGQNVAIDYRVITSLRQSTTSPMQLNPSFLSSRMISSAVTSARSAPTAMISAMRAATSTFFNNLDAA